MNITALISLYLFKSQSVAVTSDITINVGESLLYVIQNYFMQYTNSFVIIISCQQPHHLYYYLDLIEYLFNVRDTVKVEVVINKIGDGYVGPVDGNFNLIFADSADSFMDLMEEIFNHGEAMKLQIVMNDISAEHIRAGERNLNLIFVDCADSFVNIDPASKVKNYDINEYYFVFVQNRDHLLPEDVQRILDYCWKHYIINVDVLIQKATGELLVYTYFPFTPSHCGKVVPVEVNQFRNGRMDNDEIFPAKLLNMHDCPVKVALWDLPPFLSINMQKTGRNAIGGFEGELLKTLSEIMNFRIDYKILSNTDRGLILENGTTEAVHMLQRKEADLAIGFFVFSIATARMLTATDTYYQSREIFVVLKESPNYSTPEMIFYPFSPSIWILLMTTFTLVLGFLSAIITWARRNSLLEISRVTVRNLWMHMFAMTLGMPSELNPKRYFGKLIIITWMMCTLVMRAQYQSLLYHLIRHNFFEHPPNSLEEVIQQGYKFIMNHYTYNALSSVPLFQEANLKTKSLANIELGVVFSYMTDHPDEKLVAVEPNEFFLYYGAQNHKAGVFVPLPETMLVQSTCMYLTKHSFLINRMNELIRWMSAYGFMTSWVSKALDLSYFMVPTEAKRAIIGQNELRVAFCLFGMLLLLSSIVFFLELLSLRCRILKKVLEKL